MTFIRRRQMMDASFIANECLDTRLKGDIPGVLCKVVIENAYNHIRGRIFS